MIATDVLRFIIVPLLCIFLITDVQQTHPSRGNIQGGPKKVSHYGESSLNRIKNHQPG